MSVRAAVRLFANVNPWFIVFFGVLYNMHWSDTLCRSELWFSGLFDSLFQWISGFPIFLVFSALINYCDGLLLDGIVASVISWYIGTLVHCNVFELPIVAISFHLQVLLRWRPCFPVWKHPTWLTTTDQSVINFCATLLDIKSMEAIKSLPIRSVPSIDKPSVFAHLHSKLLSCFPPLATITEWTEIFMTGGFFPDYGEPVSKAQWGQLERDKACCCSNFAEPYKRWCCSTLLGKCNRKDKELLRCFPFSLSLIKLHRHTGSFCRIQHWGELYIVDQSPIELSESYKRAGGKHFVVVSTVYKKRKNPPFGPSKPLVTQPWLRSFFLGNILGEDCCHLKLVGDSIYNSECHQGSTFNTWLSWLKRLSRKLVRKVGGAAIARRFYFLGAPLGESCASWVCGKGSLCAAGGGGDKAQQVPPGRANFWGTAGAAADLRP